MSSHLGLYMCTFDYRGKSCSGRGLLASCYALFDHDLAHLILTLVHLFPLIEEMVFGDDNGFLIYVKIGIEMGRLMFSTTLYQLLGNFTD